MNTPHKMGDFSFRPSPITTGYGLAFGRIGVTYCALGEDIFRLAFARSG